MRNDFRPLVFDTAKFHLDQLEDNELRMLRDAIDAESVKRKKALWNLYFTTIIDNIEELIEEFDDEDEDCIQIECDNCENYFKFTWGELKTMLLKYNTMNKK